MKNQYLYLYMLIWLDLKLPPINLWSLPKMNKQVYKDDDTFDFTLIDEEDEPEIIDSKVLRELHLKDDFDWENERELEALYGNFDE